jgi:hypothetical protein
MRRGATDARASAPTSWRAGDGTTRCGAASGTEDRHPHRLGARSVRFDPRGARTRRSPGQGRYRSPGAGRRDSGAAHAACAEETATLRPPRLEWCGGHFFLEGGKCGKKCRMEIGLRLLVDRTRLQGRLWQVAAATTPACSAAVAGAKSGRICPSGHSCCRTTRRPPRPHAPLGPGSSRRSLQPTRWCARTVAVRCTSSRSSRNCASCAPSSCTCRSGTSRGRPRSSPRRRENWSNSSTCPGWTDLHRPAMDKLEQRYRNAV